MGFPFLISEITTIENISYFFFLNFLSNQTCNRFFNQQFGFSVASGFYFFSDTVINELDFYSKDQNNIL